MRRFALSAVGRDRPGIVAGVSRVLLEHGINIEDSQMTILRGHFAMTLIVAGQDPDALALRRDLESAADDLGLDATALQEIAEDSRRTLPRHPTSSPSTESTIPGSSTRSHPRSPRRAGASPTSTRGCSATSRTRST